MGTSLRVLGLLETGWNVRRQESLLSRYRWLGWLVNTLIVGAFLGAAWLGLTQTVCAADFYGDPTPIPVVIVGPGRVTASLTPTFPPPTPIDASSPETPPAIWLLMGGVLVGAGVLLGRRLNQPVQH